MFLHAAIALEASVVLYIAKHVSLEDGEFAGFSNTGVVVVALFIPCSVISFEELHVVPDGFKRIVVGNETVAGCLIV